MHELTRHNYPLQNSFLMRQISGDTYWLAPQAHLMVVSVPRKRHLLWS